jgi:Domain of unknown function (DUF4126)
MTGQDLFLPVALGISLAAATGFRVFLPLLILGVGAREGLLPVSSGFDWVTTWPALLMLVVASVTEIAAYYVPGLDNLLDTVAAPAAVGAGILASAAVLGPSFDASPMLKWTLAIIAGGGAAAVTQSATTLLRGKSTVFTGGAGNHLIATSEIVGALGLSLMAVVLPYVAAGMVCIVGLLVFRVWWKRRMTKSLT